MSTASSANTALKDLMNEGDPANLSVAHRAGAVGTILAMGGGGGFLVHEKGLVVKTNKCTPTYNVEAVLAAKTTTSGTTTRKNPVSNAATLAAGQVQGKDSSAVGTKEIDFFASEVADNSTCEVVYLTFDVPLDSSGNPAISLASGVKGSW